MKLSASWLQQLVQQPAGDQTQNYQYSLPLARQQQPQAQVFRLEEDASQVLSLQLAGGPKWGFRIRQLNDQRVIVSRVNRGLAEKAGLKVNDELLAVNQVPLGNKPRSLLLQQQEQLDDNDDTSEKPRQAPRHSGSSSVAAHVESGKENERKENEEKAVGASVELSKLDFAYQLIKHSSISNKLMLTVKRYLNPAYARASVAASQQAASSNEGAKEEEEEAREWQAGKRAHHTMSMGGLHYTYKCCECYCDQEGSRQSADEEVERRLLAQLQNKQRHEQQQREQQQQQQHQREQQLRQLREQQERRQLADCCHHAHDNAEEEDEEEEEQEPPEVPMRRSSQFGLGLTGETVPPPQLPNTLYSSVQQVRRNRGTTGEMGGQQWCFRPPPPPPPPSSAKLREKARTTLGPRPSQAPPLPPPAKSRRLMEPAMVVQSSNDYEYDGDAEEAEGRRVASRSRSQPPRNIWSPSTTTTTSATSSANSPAPSSASDSLNQVASREPLRAATSTSSNSATNLVPADLSTPSPQSTVVERRLAAGEFDEELLPPPPPLLDDDGDVDGNNSDSNSNNKHDVTAKPLAGGANERKLIAPAKSLADGGEQLATGELSNVEGAALEVELDGSGLKQQLVQGERNNNDKELEIGRSYSVVSLGQRVTRQARPRGELASFGQQPRSYSLGGPNSVIGGVDLARQQHLDGSQQAVASGDKKYWTLPGGATADNFAGLENECNRAESQTQLAMEQQQQEQSASAMASTSEPAARWAHQQQQQRQAHQMMVGRARGEDTIGGLPSDMQQPQSASTLPRQRSADRAEEKRHKIGGEQYGTTFGWMGPRGGQQQQLREEVYQLRTEERTTTTTYRQPHHHQRQPIASKTPRQRQHYHFHQNSELEREANKGMQPGGLRDEWFRQMYKQMHNKGGTSAENKLLQAVNSQTDTSQPIKIQLKSPKVTDHQGGFSPSNFETESGRCSVSPVLGGNFKPGNISDYVPGESSISQHERNLELYYKLIDHIDRLFSSVLPLEVISRSTNTLQAVKQSRRRKRQAQLSKSGPQTPVGKRTDLYCHQDRLTRSSGFGEDEHSRRCVFNQLLKDKQQHQICGLNSEDKDLADEDDDDDGRDPHKQYVAVQQGRDIPLKGLRKPAPQPNIYRVGPAPPAFRLRPSQSKRETQLQYQEHLRQLTATNATRSPDGSSATLTNFVWPASELDQDVFRDFENVYESMRQWRPRLNQNQVRQQRLADEAKLEADQIRRSWSRTRAFETEQLAESLRDVVAACNFPRHSPLPGPSSAHLTEASLIKPATILAAPPSPMSLSIATSEQTNRADSRNTNLSYQNGPALVEEMTLSDLEDEISSSLLQTKEACRSSSSYFAGCGDQLTSRRNRNPLPGSLSHYMDSGGPVVVVHRPADLDELQLTSGGFQSDYTHR